MKYLLKILDLISPEKDNFRTAKIIIKQSYHKYPPIICIPNKCDLNKISKYIVKLESAGLEIIVNFELRRK